LRHRGGLCGQTELGGDRRDGPGERDIALGEAAGVVAGEQDVHAGVGDREIGMVVHLVRGGTDTARELEALRHRARAERGLKRLQQHAPVVQAVACADLAGGELVLLLVHVTNLAKECRPETEAGPGAGATAL
jgi:hypothetical protein